MKKREKKLSLHRETITNLLGPEKVHAAEAWDSLYGTCLNTCVAGCGDKTEYSTQDACY